MRRQLVLPLALLFIALGVPSNAQSEAPGAGGAAAAAPDAAGAVGAAGAAGAAGTAGAAGADAAGEVVFYDVGRPFSFNCSVPRTPDSGSIVWRKNGTQVEDVWDLRGRYALDDGVFKSVGRTHEDDFGNYSCALGGAAPARSWQLRGRPHAKLPESTNVVEGQKLKLVCKVVGKPYPTVTWQVANASDDGATYTDVLAALGTRVSLVRSDQGVEGAELVLEAAMRGDAGKYICKPADEHALNSTTVLRVKDMYAALWPFLGICAEVFVLCAIILVYEKRRTKPELDDSDTDNHEQKKS